MGSYAVLSQGRKQLTRFDAKGAQIGDAWQPTYDDGCSALSHEVFIDSTTSRNQVLSIMHAVTSFDGTPTAYTLGQKMVRWDHINNTMEELFNVFSDMDPRVD